MKLYNPIVNGFDINIDGKILHTDEEWDFIDESLAMGLQEKYPFLIELSSEKYSPDRYVEKERMSWRRIKRGLKRIF